MRLGTEQKNERRAKHEVGDRRCLFARIPDCGRPVVTAQPDVLHEKSTRALASRAFRMGRDFGGPTEPLLSINHCTIDHGCQFCFCYFDVPPKRR